MPNPTEPEAPREFTAQQKYREIARELAQRENLFARLVAEGKLPRSEAERRIAILKAIARDYDARHQTLFGGAVL